MTNCTKKVHGGTVLFGGKRPSAASSAADVSRSSQGKPAGKTSRLIDGNTVPKLKKGSDPKPLNSRKEKQAATEAMCNNFFKEKPNTISTTIASFGLSSGPSQRKPPIVGRGKDLVKKVSMQQSTGQKSKSYLQVQSPLSSDVRHPQKPDGLPQRDAGVHSESASRQELSRKPSHKGQEVASRSSGLDERSKIAPKGEEFVSVLHDRTNWRANRTPKRCGPPLHTYRKRGRSHVVSPDPGRKQSRIGSLDFFPQKAKKRVEELVDLTADSDDEGGVSHTPSRKDLLDVTGSSSTGVDRSDLSLGADTINIEDNDSEPVAGGECSFLQNWVGSHELLRELSTRGEEEAAKEEASTVKAPGMGSFVLDRSTLKCLANNTWLNDEVVNAYMALLSLRSAIDLQSEEGSEGEGEENDSEAATARERHGGGLRCEFFSSFFYALLRNAKDGYSYDNVKRWARKKDLAACDRIFFPINVSNSHWCLAVVFPKEKCIRYYDSMGGQNQNCLDLLERYLQDEGREKDSETLQGKWRKENVGPGEVPRQMDGSSCGVFLCGFADCLSAGKQPEGFAQRDIPSIRKEFRKFLELCRM